MFNRCLFQIRSAKAISFLWVIWLWLSLYFEFYLLFCLSVFPLCFLCCKNHGIIALKRNSFRKRMRSTREDLACAANVSMLFRSKERPRNEILGFARARNETRAKKWKRGEGEGKEGNACRQTPGFWKHAFASERSAWLGRLLDRCRSKVCSDLMRARIPNYSLEEIYLLFSPQDLEIAWFFNSWHL